MIVKKIFFKLNLSGRNRHRGQIKSAIRLNAAPPTGQCAHGPRGLTLSCVSAWFQPKEEGENTEAT